MGDPIGSLPTELRGAILEYFDSPYDLFAIIKASPHALQSFKQRRQRLVQPFIDNLEARCNGRIHSTAVLAAHLRHSRSETADNAPPSELEAARLPAIATYRDVVASNSPTQLPATLSNVCALWSVIEEGEWITEEYSPEAWENMKSHLQNDRPWGQPIPRESADIAERIELTDTERQKFLVAACRFESYCQAFFDHQTMLFEEDHDMRRLLFEEGSVFSVYTNIESFYSILYYIYNVYWVLFFSVIDFLRVSPQVLTDSQETAEANAILARYAGQPAEAAHPELQLCRFRHRTIMEMHKYIHWLVCQGMGMFAAVRRMSLEDRVEFVLASFFSITVTPHPTVLLLNAIEGHRKGIVGNDKWIPWVYCDIVSYDRPDGWHCATAFWDEDRISEVLEANRQTNENELTNENEQENKDGQANETGQEMNDDSWFLSSTTNDTWFFTPTTNGA